MIIHQDRVTTISAEQQVVLYPTYGYLVDSERSWRVTVAGCVFQPGQVSFQKRVLLRLLQRVMGADPEQLQTQIFHDRIQGFLAQTGPVKQIAVRIGEDFFALPKKTRRNGQFRAHFRIPRQKVEQWKSSGLVDGDCLPISVVTPNGHSRGYEGQIRLIPNRGVSVITDIDDTIKHTQVTCRRSMLENTFLHEFRPIGGMLERYREWSADGTAFHYVSSSPWQLFSPIFDLIDGTGFPEGTVHLRSFRIRDHMLRHMMLIRRGGKSAVIRDILKSFQDRSFVLVGDSGEKDPKIYANLARQFPRQVQGIYIRQLDAKPMDELQCRKIFRKLPKSKWQLFTCPSELPEDLITLQSEGITPCQ